MKKGFTLAEVLITLGIIGVVAAMTLPSLIINQRAKEFNTRLNTASAILSQAIDKMYADGESLAIDDYKAKEFKKVFKKYFIESRDCVLMIVYYILKMMHIETILKIV